MASATLNAERLLIAWLQYLILEQCNGNNRPLDCVQLGKERLAPISAKFARKCKSAVSLSCVNRCSATTFMMQCA